MRFEKLKNDIEDYNNLNDSLPCPLHDWKEEIFTDQFGEIKHTLRCKKCKKTVREINT